MESKDWVFDVECVAQYYKNTRERLQTIGHPMRYYGADKNVALQIKF